MNAPASGRGVRLGVIDGLTLLVAGAAIVLGIVTVLDRGAPPPAGPPVREVAGFDSLAAGARAMGDARAAVRIVEFSDFQCPYCAQVQEALREVRREAPDGIVVLFRHWPLTRIHPHAFAAAEAAECAGDQGRFEPMHDALFAAQDSIGVLAWTEFARRASVPDLQRFERCVADRTHRETVERDKALAEGLNLAGTPAIIVEGRLLPGTPSAERLRDEIESARKSSPRSGTP